jgi:PAS domain S-box-containing protein
MGMLGVRQFQVLAILAAAMETLAFVWVIEAAHRRIRQLKSATDGLCLGQSWPEMPPHSWEWNAIGRNLQRLQRQIAEGREEAARLFEDTPAAYLEADAQGAVKRANRRACRLLGRPSEEVCRMTLWEVFGVNEGPASQEQLLGRLDRKEAAETFDEKYLRPDGTELVVGVQERLLHDVTGAPIGTGYLLTNLTPILRAAETVAHCEQELRLKDGHLAQALAETEDALQAKSRFLSNVSNDLRVPLNTIVGFVELMLDGKIGSKVAERRECLSDILASARELTGLVDRLLDQGKKEAVNEPLVCPETVDLETLVYDIRHLMQALSTPSHGVRIRVDLDPQVRYVTADREALRLLVASYLSYAGKRVRDGSEVVVRTVSQDAGSCRLEVAYSGVAADGTDDATLARDLESEAELAHAKQLVAKRGGRTGVQNIPGRGIVLYAILHPVGELARRRLGDSMILKSGGETARGQEARAIAADNLGQSLEALGVRRDCGKPILVAGRTPEGVQSIMGILTELGHYPVWLHDRNAILQVAGHQQPASVVVDLRNGPADYEFVSTTLREAGVSTPVLGFPGEIGGAERSPGVHRITVPALSESGKSKPRLKSLAGGGRKRSA